MHTRTSDFQRFERNSADAAKHLGIVLKQASNAVQQRIAGAVGFAVDTAVVLGMAASTLVWLGWEAVAGTGRRCG